MTKTHRIMMEKKKRNKEKRIVILIKWNVPLSCVKWFFFSLLFSTHRWISCFNLINWALRFYVVPNPWIIFFISFFCILLNPVKKYKTTIELNIGRERCNGKEIYGWSFYQIRNEITIFFQWWNNVAKSLLERIY